VTQTQIIQLIQSGENSFVEFKSSKVRAESIAKEMVSFSNSLGGTIFIGVEDNASITGCDISFNYEEWIMNISRTSVIPAIIPVYNSVYIDEKLLVVIDIPKGSNKPYQTKDNRFLIRVGSTNRTATQVELMRLFQQSGFFHYDLTAVSGTSAGDLNFSQLDNYYSSYDVDFYNESEDEKIQLLKNVDILSGNDECTVAGILLFGINPQRKLMNASISVARFKGDDINDELIDSKVIEGTLPVQVNTATSLINNLISVPSIIEGNKRVDTIARYSSKVYRELIVNAVVHRNYSIIGSRIRIFIFDNRIEFKSPGRLPNTVTIEKIIAGVSYAVNPVIVKFMENMRYIDKLGRGIPMVYREAKLIGKSVQFEEIGEEFIVTLFLR